MANSIDYVKRMQHVSFDEEPFNVIDALVLTEIGYLPFEDIVPFDLSGNESILLKDMLEEYVEYDKHHRSNIILELNQRYALVKALLASERFADVCAFGFVNDINVQIEKQFSAIVYQAPSFQLVVFRGTDDMVVSWKEDFKLAYMSEIPAQHSAKKYLMKVLEKHEGSWYVAGHSKGGNLAVYASSQLDVHEQERICQVFCFDGPGMLQEIVESAGYQHIKEKVKAYRPQNSIVSIIMEQDIAPITVKSTAVGLAQHISFSWQIENNSFVELPELEKASKILEETFQKWVNKHTEKELEQFFDYMFEPLLESNVSSVGDFSTDFFATVRQVVNSIQNVEEDKKKIIDDKLRMLFDIWNEVRRSYNLTAIESLWGKELPVKPVNKRRRRPKRIVISN